MDPGGPVYGVAAACLQPDAASGRASGRSSHRRRPVWDDGRHGRTGIRPRRRHRRVRHAGRRRQGQGAQGRRPAGHRLRRRRAGLPDPRLHRRGRRRRGPRPQEPPLHAGRRHARAARSDRRQDRPRHAATRSRPPRCWSPTAASRPSTTPSPRCATRATRCCSSRRTGRPTPRRSSWPAASRSRSSPTRPPATWPRVEQLEAARTERTKVLLFVSPSNPTGAVYPRGRGRGHRRVGARARPVGRHRRDLRAPGLRRRRDGVDRAQRRPATRSSSSTGWPRPTR